LVFRGKVAESQADSIQLKLPSCDSGTHGKGLTMDDFKQFLGLMQDD